MHALLPTDPFHNFTPVFITCSRAGTPLHTWTRMTYDLSHVCTATRRACTSLHMLGPFTHQTTHTESLLFCFAVLLPCSFLLESKPRCLQEFIHSGSQEPMMSSVSMATGEEDGQVYLIGPSSDRRQAIGQPSSGGPRYTMEISVLP